MHNKQFFENMMRLTCLSPLPDFSGVLNYKEIGKTHLKVYYQGNMRVMSARACNRWFFTFNGVECSMPIDAAVYSGGVWSIIRAATIVGYCSGVPKGHVIVGLNVGSCAGYKQGDAFTGWNSVSRIIVEEVETPF